jgi:hypothetical protein
VATGNGTIIVIPSEGLSNRLRVIATASKLARNSNKKILVYWEANSNLNATYQDLFEDTGTAITQPPLKYRIWLKMIRQSLRLRFVSKIYLDFFRFDFIYLDSMIRLVKDGQLNLQQEIDKSKEVFFCSCEEFEYFDASDYQSFLPKKKLKENIDLLSNKFNAKTIGIHIRSTDNEWSKKNSPFHLFINKIEEEIAIDESVNFFVSTDNEAYQKELLNRFGENRIFIHQKEFRRDTKKGIEDAVIDIFCLSKTTKIYGSYWSSFSEVASRIGNIPITFLTKTT